MSFDKFAQAAALPGSGASRAADFQPPTRNPQAAPGSLQPSASGPQATGSGDILNNPNLQLSVPVNSTPDTEPTPSQPANGGINWLLVIIITVVIVVAAETILRKREQRSLAPVNDQIIDSASQTKLKQPVKLKQKSKKSRKQRKRR